MVLTLSATDSAGGCAGLHGVLQLLHHADEGMREPHRVPGRRDPLAAGGLCRGIGKRRGGAGRPADRALGDALRALDAPVDVLVVLVAILARTGPHILQRHGQHARREFHRRDGDAVGMVELRARILAGQRRDLVRIAEQEAQHVEMMHAHIGERQPVVLLEERLPVRDRMHVDLREDDVAKRAADR